MISQPAFIVFAVLESVDSYETLFLKKKSLARVDLVASTIGKKTDMLVGLLICVQISYGM